MSRIVIIKCRGAVVCFFFEAVLVEFAAFGEFSVVDDESGAFEYVGCGVDSARRAIAIASDVRASIVTVRFPSVNVSSLENMPSSKR